MSQRKILMGAGWGLSAYLSGQSESLGVKKKPSVVEDLLHRGLYGFTSLRILNLYYPNLYFELKHHRTDLIELLE